MANICRNEIAEPFALAQRAICFQPYAKIDTKYVMFALMSEVKASIGILTALPFIVGGFLWFQNPGYISILFTTQRGRFVLFCAIALLSTGLAVMQIMIKRTLKGA